MSEPIEPIRHKLTEALPEAKEDGPKHGATSPGQVPGAPSKSDVKKHNADVQPGIKDHMVDIGRGEQIKGRGGD